MNITSPPVQTLMPMANTMASTSTRPVTTMSPSTSNFQLIFNSAVKAYERRTKTDILAHPLASQLQACNSPGSILDVLHGQVDDLAQVRRGDERLKKWLDPTINVLLAFSGILGEGVSLAFSPATVIFAGAGVLLQAAKDVSTAEDALIDIFERVEEFFKRLGTYTEVPPTAAMTDTIVKIMVEVLNIFAIATKEIKQGRTKKFLKKLVGKTDLEDALIRLDKLTQEEVRMATAQLLKIAHAIDDKVTKIDGGVKGVDDKVNDVNDTVKLVLDDGKETKEIVQQAARETTAIMQLMSTNVDEAKRNQWRQDLRNWFSSPDPSTNHIISWGAQHDGTTMWFFRGSLFEEWKLAGSLLWIHGKPGAGKSVLCSAIIQDIMTLHDAGQALMAYFYFDFKDTEKQNRRNLVLSLLSQLSARSDLCYDMLYCVYRTHNNGAHKPTDDTLIQSLKEALTFSNHGSIYIIMDAIDECPNTFGLPSPRELVLDLVKELIGLSLPNLHLCVTSRPEIDIRTALESLTPRQLSLHDQSGQNEDINEYIRSVVRSDPRMGKWREEDQNLVIETLSDKADGMFRWVFCQLETIRHCFPTSLRRILRELPESLDGTYERILKDMTKATRGHAHRLLQCLTVAVRPLRLEELAEVLAFDFDDAPGGIPNLDANWRREDQEEAVLSTCSSLITVVHDGESRVVQFSHFSVKEFLTSDRLATAIGDVSFHHILLEPAHTILAQACLGVLLRLDDSTRETSIKHSPLAEYAAQHWVDHTLFGNVSSHVKDGMDHLFDMDKPHFLRWIQIHDMDYDHGLSGGDGETRPEWLEVAPVYYAALCGSLDVVEKLISEHPEHVSSWGGFCGTPLHAASRSNHPKVVQLLLKHGADVNAPNQLGWTPLLSATHRGHLKIVRLLLEHGADVNTEKAVHWTPLHLASANGCFEIVQTLFRHNADVDAQVSDGDTPLHYASRTGPFNIARLLLDHGADPKARGAFQNTPLYYASQGGHLEIGQLLLEHGADVHAQTSDGDTPLHGASRTGYSNVAPLLLDHGADPEARDKKQETPLHFASRWGRLEMGQLLLEHGVEVNARNEDDRTPLHLAAYSGHLKLVQTLLRHSEDVHAQASDGDTPLHSSLQLGHVDIARLLLDHGADPMARGEKQGTLLHFVSQTFFLLEITYTEIGQLLLERGVDVNAKNDDHETPLHLAAYSGHLELVQMLIRHNADVNAQTSVADTPLHGASDEGHVDIARLLLEHGADVEALGKWELTPLHLASLSGHLEIALLLLEYGAYVNAKADEHWTPLHLASAEGHFELVQTLLRNNADVNAQNSDGDTPLHAASESGHVDVARFLLDLCADPDARGSNQWSPLHFASRSGHLEMGQLLLKRGADVNAKGDDCWTPLHMAAAGIFKYCTDNEIWTSCEDTVLISRSEMLDRRSEMGLVDIARLLLDHGADPNARGKNQWTPLHLASRSGHLEFGQLLLERGADVNAKDDDRWTPLHLAAAAELFEHLADDTAQTSGQYTALRWMSKKGLVDTARLLLVADLLLERGADVDAEDDEGDTAYQIALKLGHDEFAQLLAGHGVDVEKKT